MRVRLLGRAGVQGSPRGGLPDHPGELESGDDHDRPGDGRRHLHRADHLADDRQDHRARASRRAPAHDGRADRAQLRARPGARGRADEIRRRIDRRVEESDRQGGRPGEVQGGDDAHRARFRALRHCAQPRAGARRAAGHRLSRRDTALVHAGRHRRRHRLQQGRVRRDVQARSRSLSHSRAPDRGIAAGLERVRDGSRPRPQGQLHHRLLDREPRPDGRAHRRLDHRRAGADADRQGIPDHARRLDRRVARGRRRHGRVERAVRDRSRRRPHDRDRDEPARVALVGARVEGHRLSDRQGGGEARRRLHAGRAPQRDHGRRDAGVVRAVDRLRRHQGAAVRLREVQGGRRPAHHADEIRRRSDGDRPHVPGVAAEGAARAGDRCRRLQSQDRRSRQDRRRARVSARRAPLVRRRCLRRRDVDGGSPPVHEDRPVVPGADQGDRRRRAQPRAADARGAVGGRPARVEAHGLCRPAHRASPQGRRRLPSGRGGTRSACAPSTSASTRAPRSSPRRPPTSTRRTRRSARPRRPTGRR